MTEKYIQSLQNLKNHQINNPEDFLIIKNNTISIIRRIYGIDSSQENRLDFIVYRKYPTWNFGGENRVSGGDNFESCKKQLIGLIDGVIDELTKLGLPTKDSENSSEKLNLVINQSQVQTINVEIIMKSIKQEISIEEFKAIMDIIKTEENIEFRKSKLLEKFKSFGKDTLSNIFANLLTNPSLYI